MNRTLYTLLFYLITPVMFIRLLWLSLSNPPQRRRWRERVVVYGAGEPPPSEHKHEALVFHAVSVGEVHASQQLILALRERFPDCRIIVTCSTPTGSDRIKALLGDKVEHVYLPYDMPGAVERFLTHFSPRLVVMMETELWPNMLYYCKKSAVQTMLINARLSERSRRGYARFPVLVREMLDQLGHVAAQSEADAKRFLSLGLAVDKITITGSMKYDMNINQKQGQAGRALRSRLFGERPVLIAASTREGEDEKVVAAFSRILEKIPDMAFVLVPRHPERFSSAREVCETAGLRVATRSNPGGPELQVLVGDTMGEMQMYYSMADVAFVGGSLVDTGCQNILEPAALGLPVITGPSLYNFQAISDDLRQAGALKVVRNEEELAELVSSLFTRRERRQAMAVAAEQVFARQRGASEKILGLISARLS